MNSKGNQPFSIEAVVVAGVILLASSFFLVTHDNAVRPPSELWPKIFHWVASHYVPYRETHPLPPPVPTLPPLPWYVHYVYPVLGYSLFALAGIFLLLDWRLRKEDPEASIMDRVLESILDRFRLGRGGKSADDWIAREARKVSPGLASEFEKRSFLRKIGRKFGSKVLEDPKVRRILKRWGIDVD